MVPPPPPSLLDNNNNDAPGGWSALVYPAAVATAAACAISARAIAAHLRAYRRPLEQRYVIRVLAMVPVYALSSLWSLSASRSAAAEIIEAVRDLYEAFVLYSFFNLLVEHLGGERELLARLRGRAPTPHAPPISWFLLRGWDVAIPTEFVKLKRGILQFVLLKPIFAVLILLLKRSDAYTEGVIAAASPYVWVNLLYNLSVSWSMYCLVIFYMTCSHDLRDFRPLPKFLCVKAVLFFSFWQSVLISLLVYLNVIRDTGSFTTENISLTLQDFLICLEMVAAALAHDRAFSPLDFSPPTHPGTSDPIARSGRLAVRDAVRDAAGINDVAADMAHTWRGTRFAALTAADSVLRRYAAAQYGGSRWERWLRRAGIRRRFAAGNATRESYESVVAEANHDDGDAAGGGGTGAQAALLYDYDDDYEDGDEDALLVGDEDAPVLSAAHVASAASLHSFPPLASYGATENPRGTTDLDADDEAAYAHVRMHLPRGDPRYPVVEDAIDARDFAPMPSSPSCPAMGTPIARPSSRQPVPSPSAIGPRRGSFSSSAPAHPYQAAAASNSGGSVAGTPGSNTQPSPGLDPAVLRRVVAPGPPPKEYNPL
ncbi:organic solute transporter Ostalpha-domain-containing protein [Blastocladiella britannica]|nr:organic solute transporter Ostalpha-domain-containing protein [Blastocladiella britannica]